MHSLTNCFSSDISADSIRCPIASLSLSRFWKVIELWRTFWNWTFCFLFVWEMENWDFMRVSNVACDGSHCQSFDVKDKRWWWWWRWRWIYCLVTWESTILRMGLIYHITIVTLPLNIFAGTGRFSDQMGLSAVITRIILFERNLKSNSFQIKLFPFIYKKN